MRKHLGLVRLGEGDCAQRTRRCQTLIRSELKSREGSPNHVLTHAARAAAEQLNFSGTSGGRARRARRALVRANGTVRVARRTTKMRRGPLCPYGNVEWVRVRVLDYGYVHLTKCLRTLSAREAEKGLRCLPRKALRIAREKRGP